MEKHFRKYVKGLLFSLEGIQLFQLTLSDVFQAYARPNGGLGIPGNEKTSFSFYFWVCKPEGDVNVFSLIRFFPSCFSPLHIVLVWKILLRFIVA